MVKSVVFCDRVSALKTPPQLVDCFGPARRFNGAREQPEGMQFRRSKGALFEVLTGLRIRALAIAVSQLTRFSPTFTFPRDSANPGILTKKNGEPVC